MRTSAWSRIEPIDLVITAALTLATQAEIWFPGLMGASSTLQDRALLSALALATSLPLVARRVLPWAVAVVSFGAAIVQALLPTPPEGLGDLLVMLVVAWSLGRYAARPAGYGGILLVAAVSFGVGADLADHAFVLLVLGGAWGAGLLVALRTDDLGTLELRRLEATRAGAEEERQRIARELHDVVAHRVSMMVVQSQLADTLLERDPGRAHEAIASVESAGREALVELRSLLGLMHQEEPAALAPVDTDLSRLGQLVDEARRGGLPVTFEAEGAERPVPPAVSLAAFRIVQEALTNVVRHARSAPTRVRLSYRPGVVGIEVDNDGAVLTEVRPGHGLAGMAERAAFLGGTLSTRPSPRGGLRVCAELPTPGVEQ